VIYTSSNPGPCKRLSLPIKGGKGFFSVAVPDQACILTGPLIKRSVRVPLSALLLFFTGRGSRTAISLSQSAPLGAPEGPRRPQSVTWFFPPVQSPFYGNQASFYSFLGKNNNNFGRTAPSPPPPGTFYSQPPADCGPKDFVPFFAMFFFSILPGFFLALAFSLKTCPPDGRSARSPAAKGGQEPPPPLEGFQAWYSLLGASAS